MYFFEIGTFVTAHQVKKTTSKKSQLFNIFVMKIISNIVQLNNNVRLSTNKRKRKKYEYC